MARLLMLTYHFPPSAASGAFRLLGFARHLPRSGWNTVVVAPPGLPWEPTDQSLAERVPAETIVCRVPYPSWLPRVVRWLAPFGVWLPYARAAARRAVVAHLPDAVLTSGPPHGIHLLGRFLQKHYHLPWLADFRDPWVSVEGFTRPAGLRERVELSFERKVMRHADAIIANTPMACELCQSAYPAATGKIVSLTNGYDPESFPPLPVDRTSSSPVRILHAGELYSGRDPRPLLDAIASIPAGSIPPFRLEFLGRASYEKGADLEGEGRRRGVETLVRYHGQASYHQTLSAMVEADILLLMDRAGRRVGVPAKLYEYLGAGRPILAMGEDDGDLAAILSTSGVPYRIVPCDSPARIREAIVALVGGVVSGQLGTSASEQRLRFSRQELARQLAGMLDGLRSKAR
jgi:glycosyltransferase involved in cell wall biosynthesis